MKFDTSIVQTRFQSPLGTIIIAATHQGLAGLWFEGQRHLPRELLAPTLVASRTALPPEGALRLRPGKAGSAAPAGEEEPATPVASRRTAMWPSDPEHPVLKEVMRQLGEYFAGRRTEFDVPLDLAHGTAFQQSVWQALLAIPQGGTASYSEVGRRIGKPAAVRAVGAAVGRNPVSIIVPCHRVMGANGALTGYAGGLDRKTALLKLEGVLQEHRP
ncbi:MAG: methylated-DNA--[protein]-cysteine S-methyltransferase [Polaromonas sp.]|uniref:methylated-DNA--[protein]-cysteine S-methyltransferase n=1 Tax=Polaromonas sp. TaxID=1869339 RepID=UPI00272F3580|nr:methylated-DNA--[protein]-cysteine S-methyltransferase [Polaromonas sp.]MDP2452412.1 methylated-DNA--[protein]-cysteine S-methyltransferase [Polaromonas sp.]MDP3248528.1 methylated-DNA--[protein]-cysteine S-methyltransferase [Polaromonas sp.]